MKVYLAGSCGKDSRLIMENIAANLRTVFDVYCPFELKIKNAWSYSQEDWAQKVFDKDIKAIKDADMVVIISTGRISTAGTNWEQGYSYALGKKVYVFQITNDTTSLMTYCGCTNFFNINTYKDILKKLVDSLDATNKNSCTTILT